MKFINSPASSSHSCQEDYPQKALIVLKNTNTVQLQEFSFHEPYQNLVIPVKKKIYKITIQLTMQSLIIDASNDLELCKMTSTTFNNLTSTMEQYEKRIKCLRLCLKLQEPNLHHNAGIFQRKLDPNMIEKNYKT